jgi:hypothetical protein
MPFARSFVFRTTKPPLSVASDSAPSASCIWSRKTMPRSWVSTLSRNSAENMDEGWSPLVSRK